MNNFHIYLFLARTIILLDRPWTPGDALQVCFHIIMYGLSL